MSYTHPAAREGLRRRWRRHDAHRFAKPGSPEAKTGFSHPWAEVARQEQMAADEARARAAAEQDAFEREVLRLRHDFAKLKLEYELRRFQQKYSPDQSRVPAGNPDGGQWTSSGGEGISGATVRTDLANVIRICMAGSSSITTDRWGNQKHWVDYICADGFTFRNYGPGGRFRAFLPDPRF